MSAGAEARIALCHEWLVQRFGSEKTFEAMADAFPSADLYALTCNRSVPFAFGGREVRTTVLDRVPPALRDRRDLQLPLMPLTWRYAFRQPYDVVVTSSHACAKGFWPGRAALHLCYCYTPMRYLWLNGIDGRRHPNPAARALEHALKSWDLGSTRWVDEFAGISTAVQQRVQTIYDRRAVVIHPPVDTEFFTPGPGEAGGAGGFTLVVSRMIPYKRIDLAIRAGKKLDVPVVVAGSGPEEGALRALAGELGGDVTFVISPTDAALRELYRRAAVVLFPAEEDFGIVTVEAQACGTPVVALARGGSLDTVVPGLTGVLVPEQTEEALADGLRTALDTAFDPVACRTQAERFSAARFRASFLSWVSEAAARRGIDLEVRATR